MILVTGSGGMVGSYLLDGSRREELMHEAMAGGSARICRHCLGGKQEHTMPWRCRLDGWFDV